MKNQNQRSFFFVNVLAFLNIRRFIMKQILRTILLLLIATGICFTSFAHVIVGELEKMSSTETALIYLKLGYRHILPLGLDHILFVLSLFLLSPKLKPLIVQSTAFTVAHTFTLGLAMYHFIDPPAKIIEPLISISIMLVAAQNIFSPGLKKARVGIVFLFGLVHGLGFASSLSQIGLPRNAYLGSLVMFNIGVELGQLTIILLAFFLVGKWFGQKLFYHRLIVVPVSILIIIVASYWTIERIFY
jgi:hypothetical protein